MINKKFYKGVLNKVIHNNDEYVRVFHIDEVLENKNVLLNFKVFKKISENEYIPFNYEKIKDSDNDLYVKLTVCLKSEYIAMETNEINCFLDSLISYTDKTFDLVVDSVNKLSKKSNILIYKEYMGVYYTIVVEEGLGTLYEVIIDNSNIEFKYVSDKLIDKILMEDFIEYIRDDLELYIKVSENKVIGLTLVAGMRCYMEVVVAHPGEKRIINETNSNQIDEDSWNFDLTTMKFLEPISNDQMQEALKIATSKVEHIADLFIQ